ncbi:MAG: GAF domain-containing protein [Polyangiaceae bacterium]|nr:GAF domain-containing protein [Polyangiaceae bacterium]
MIWASFQQGALDRVPPLLATRWGRARQLGAPTEGPHFERGLLQGGPLRERSEAMGALRSLGAVHFERGAGWLASRGYVLLLADRDGVVVHGAGGGVFQEDARRLRLVPGVDWSEATRGTNAIGTALAERRPVVVAGAAHYSRSFHHLICYAAPVRAPDGEILGVVDATSELDRADPAVALAVSALAHALEESLRAQALVQAGASATRALLWALDQSRTPSLVIDAPGRVARCNAPAQALLGNLTGRSPEAALGLNWGALVDLASHPPAGGLAIEIDGVSVRLKAEPILGLTGVISVVVILESR